MQVAEILSRGYGDVSKAFEDLLTYFAEDSKKVGCEDFFGSTIHSFLKAFNKAVTQNAERQALEAKKAREKELKEGGGGSARKLGASPSIRKLGSPVKAPMKGSSGVTTLKKLQGPKVRPQSPSISISSRPECEAVAPSCDQSLTLTHATTHSAPPERARRSAVHGV